MMTRAFALAFAAATALAAQSMPKVAGTPVAAATLRYLDIKTGDGAPAAAGKQFTAHYTGWLTDGKQFDSSVGKKPLTFVQGRRQVIPGFDAGFIGMRAGGKRRIFIPWQLAYGEPGRGPIPPKADLIFDVELLEVKDAPATGGPAADLLLPFGELEQHVMALARAIPEEKYGWRPAEGVRSIREVLLHIAYGNQLMLHMADGVEKDELNRQVQDQFRREKEPLSKAQVLGALETGFAAVRTALETATGGSLSRDIDFWGTPTTRRGVLASLDAHIAEHEGQLIAYARMNGIVPPWSK
ncbi:MAG TPA: DinB family protein [Bryobacteraceae bacterium]|nr:DinB family protein [Bryobacteraceae bacterium]